MDKQEWETVRLVQALDKPLVAKSGEGNRLTSVMEAFDGVSRTLSDAGRALFQPIFSWHYMGAAEYEWDAIPEALGALAKDQAQLRATTVVIPGSIVHRTTRLEPRASRTKTKPKVKLPP